MPIRKLTRAVTRRLKGKKATKAKKATARTAGRKPVGDVIGVSAVRVPKGTPRATRDRGGNPRGIEVPVRRRRTAALKPARTRH